MKGIVICLCDISGVMAKPWVDAGYEAILVDPQHPQGVTREGSYTKIGHIIEHPVTMQVIDSAIASGKVVAVFGFPPCTDLAISGARWFKLKGEKDPDFQKKAMAVVHQCRDIGERSGAPWFLENPVGRISSLWRKPDHWFHPHFFTQFSTEDNYTKKTCLWTGGGFRMPEQTRDESLGTPDNRIHYAGPGPERANIRSKTPFGFAKAVYLANCT